jgi:hypothetical protein
MKHKVHGSGVEINVVECAEPLGRAFHMLDRFGQVFNPVNLVAEKGFELLKSVQYARLLFLAQFVMHQIPLRAIEFVYPKKGPERQPSVRNLNTSRLHMSAGFS